MSEAQNVAMLLPEILAAGLAVLVLFYAWRGLGGLPLVPRLMLGAMLGIIVPGSFGLSILTLSPFGGVRASDQAGISLRSPPPAESAATSAVTRPPEDIALVRTQPETSELKPPVPPAPVATPVDTARPPAESANSTTGAVSSEAAALASADTQPPGIEIAFGTNRSRAESAGSPPQFTSARADRLEFGRARSHARAMRHAAARTGVTDAEPASDSSAGPAGFELALLSREAFAAAAHRDAPATEAAKRQPVVVVPGYNTGLHAGIADAARLAGQLDDRLTPVYLFSWPSSAGIASYSYDLQSAGAAAGPLAEFVGHVAAANGADQVSILAFDLGAEPALAALERLPSSVQVRELVLVAPDLPVAGFAERMARVMPRAAHVTIYATEGTRALDVARRFYGGAARAGEARSDTVPLLPGVETILVPALRPPASPQHDAVVMGDIAALLATGARAAQRGGRQQTARGKNPGIYWQLAGQR